MVWFLCVYACVGMCNVPSPLETAKSAIGKTESLSWGNFLCSSQWEKQ